MNSKTLYLIFTLIIGLGLYNNTAADSSVGFNQINAKTTSEAVIIKGNHFILEFDKTAGGELASMKLYDGSFWNEVLDKPELTFPRIRVSDGSKEYLLVNDKDVQVSEPVLDGKKVHFQVKGQLENSQSKPSGWKIKLDFTVYAIGTLFVDMEYHYKGEEFSLSEANVSFAVNENISGSPNYKSTQLAKGYDVNCFETARFAFGVNPQKSFTNEIEVLVQSNRAMIGETDYTKTNRGASWFFANGEKNITGPFNYKNTIALAMGAAKTGKPQTNVIGQRVYHWVNFIDVENWYPSNKVIDEMVENGGTMLILHHEWMLDRGSNCDPHADYSTVRDHNDMVRCIDYAHEKGMRVALYMRGVEMYGLESNFFQKYCRKNWDGIYVDWHGPLGIAYHDAHFEGDKIGGPHYSSNGTYLPVKKYFQFTRKLREIVGPKGFLIGHQGSFNSGIFANVYFDAYLPGETRTERNMFKDIDNAIYKGMTGAGVTMPWPEESPVFRSMEGAAKMAAWGFYPHALMGFKIFSLDPSDSIHEPILAYWNILRTVNQEKCRVYNMPSENLTVLTTNRPQFDNLVYKESPDRYLIITANLGERSSMATLKLDTHKLAMTGKYKVYRINTNGDKIFTGTTDNTITTTSLEQWGLEGYLLEK